MRINEKDIKHWNMEVVSFSYQPLSISRNVFNGDGRLLPILGATNVQSKEMVLVAEFRDKRSISRLISEFARNKLNIINIDDGYLYKCFLGESQPKIDEYWNGWYSVTIPLSVLQIGHRVIHSFTSGKNFINIKGTWDAEMIIEVMPKRNTNSVVIKGIVEIKNLKKGIKVTVDGQRKKVYSDNEENKYSDCVFYNNQFPRLPPGAHEISFNSLDVTIKVYYDPIFI